MCIHHTVHLLLLQKYVWLAKKNLLTLTKNRNKLKQKKQKNNSESEAHK